MMQLLLPILKYVLIGLPKFGFTEEKSRYTDNSCACTVARR